MALKLPETALILDGIRRDATSDYRRRIPSATQGSVAATARALFEYPAFRNEFISALVNKVGVTVFNSAQFENPLAPFKRGMLENGSSIEEITVGLIKATTYSHDDDSGERELFGRSTPDVSVQYHTVNREDKYKLTVEYPTLKRAFLSDTGMTQFITELLESPQTSDQWDEFLLMVSLFAEVDRSSGFFRIQVEDVGAAGSTAAQARGLMRRVRETADNLTFVSSRYNPLGMPTAVKRDDLILFTTPEANAGMDVEGLAAMFHMEKGDVPAKVIVIPREHWRIPGAQALLTTEKFFVVADQLLETTQMDNGAGLYTNYWLHHWQVMSASLAAPAVLFTTDEGTVIELTDDPEITAVDVVNAKDRDGNVVTAVKRGELYQIANTVTTSPDDNGNDGVRYSIVGASSSFTRITSTGVLHVGLDEAATSLSIVGTASDDNSDATDTLVLTVYGDKVIFLPPEVIPDADSDGLNEVTPDALTVDDDDNVVIPSVTGVQYKRAGVNVNNGSVEHITGSTVFTAVARAGYELAVGAPASWTLAP